MYHTMIIKGFWYLVNDWLGSSIDFSNNNGNIGDKMYLGYNLLNS